MEIGSIQSIANAIPKTKITEKSGDSQFENLFKGVIEGTMKAQAESNTLTEQFIKGGDVQIHEVMIAGEKAKTSLQLLMEIRNKSMDMYKELTRIQIWQREFNRWMIFLEYLINLPHNRKWWLVELQL